MKPMNTKLRLLAAVAGVLVSAGTMQAQTHVIVTNLLFSEDFSSYSAGTMPTTTDAGGLWGTITYTDTVGSAGVVTDDANLFGQGTENKFFRATSTRLLTMNTPTFVSQDVAIFEFDFIGHWPAGDGARWLQAAIRTGSGWAQITSMRIYDAVIRTATTDVPANPSYGGNDKTIRIWTVMNNKLEDIVYDRPDGAGTESLAKTNASVWIYHYDTSSWEHLIPKYCYGRASALNGFALDNFRFLLDSDAALRSFDVDNVKVYGTRAVVPPPTYIAITNLLFKEDFNNYPVGGLPTTVANGGQWGAATWTGTIGLVDVAEDTNDVFGLGVANRYLQASNANYLYLTTPTLNPKQEVIAFAFDFVGHYYAGIDGDRWLNIDPRGAAGAAHVTSLSMFNTSIRGTSASYGPNDSVVRVLTVLNNRPETATEGAIAYDRPDGLGTATLAPAKASIWIRAAGYPWEQVVPEFTYSRTAGFPFGAEIDNIRFYLDSGANRSCDLDNIEVYGSIKPIPLPVRLRPKP